MGKVRFFGVGAKWKKHCETANFLVTYTKKDTGGLLNGEEARELSSRNYGPDEWWLLLDPTGSSCHEQIWKSGRRCTWFGNRGLKKWSVNF